MLVSGKLVLASQAMSGPASIPALQSGSGFNFQAFRVCEQLLLSGFKQRCCYDAVKEKTSFVISHLLGYTER